MELNQGILAKISREAKVNVKQTEATLVLLEDQATVPFIARYRKDVTGNLDEVQIRTIAERHEYYKELRARRTTILKSIEEQGKLTEDLRNKIQDCYEKNELEDLYLPYKPKRKTKSTVAIDRGLEPLARFIWEQVPGEKSIEELAETFINSEKGVSSKEEALEGALHIIAEWVSENPEIRKPLRQMTLQEMIATHSEIAPSSRRMVGLPQSPSKLSNDTFTRFAMIAVRERRGVTTPVDEDHSIQALIVDRAHEALRVWIQIGRPWRDISRATALSEKTDQRPDGGNGWCWPGYKCSCLSIRPARRSCCACRSCWR